MSGVIASLLLSCDSDSSFSPSLCASESSFIYDSGESNLRIYYDLDNKDSGVISKGSETLQSQSSMRIQSCSTERMACLEGYWPMFAPEPGVTNWEIENGTCNIRKSSEGHVIKCNLSGQRNVVLSYEIIDGKIQKVNSLEGKVMSSYIAHGCPLKIDDIRSFSHSSRTSD